MFVHINHKEITQLPMDHNGVSSMDELCPTRCMVSCRQMTVKRQGHGQIAVIFSSKH